MDFGTYITCNSYGQKDKIMVLFLPPVEYNSHLWCFFDRSENYTGNYDYEGRPELSILLSEKPVRKFHDSKMKA